MNTVAMNENAFQKITAKLSPETSAKVMVRAATINKESGRCLFDFGGIHDGMVAVAVVFEKKQPKQFYVIPGRVAPQKLLLKPGSPASKWHGYYCGSSKKLTEMIEQTLAFVPPSALLAELS